jgi:hypothetical protein
MKRRGTTLYPLPRVCDDARRRDDSGLCPICGRPLEAVDWTADGAYALAHSGKSTTEVTMFNGKSNWSFSLGGCRREQSFDEESITCRRASVRNLLISRMTKSIPDRLLVAVLVLLPVVLVGLSFLHPALVVPSQAQAPTNLTSEEGRPTTCTADMLEGTYGVLEQGTAILPVPIPGTPPPPFPVVNSAIATYDGDGKFWGKWTGSFGGANLSGTFTGSYEVKPDCSYSDKFSPLPGLDAHHSGIIVGHGMFQEIQFMYTDPFVFATGTAKKTPPRGCSQETLEGTYAVLGQGTDVSIPLPPFTPPFPMGHVAKLTADGGGHVSGAGTEDTNGFTFPATYAGTYTVSSDCAVSFVIEDTALGTTMSIPLQGMITREGRFQEIHTVVTGPGQVFSDTMRKE